MPHKHSRSSQSRRKDESSHDLPPNALARPLPVGNKSPNASTKRNKPLLKNVTKSRNAGDDTPKDFIRVMAMQNKRKRAQKDDDQPRDNKRKRDRNSASVLSQQPQSHTPISRQLSRQPGERFADFYARVDQALPISGLKRKGKKQNEEVMKERQTKTERRLQEMQADWRREDAKIKEREQELRDEEEEREALEGNGLGQDAFLDRSSSAGKMKRRKKGGAGNQDDDDGDPWAVLEEKRRRPTSLHDVAQAPPQFKRIPKEKFKVSNGAMVNVTNVPVASGSLRRREELGAERQDVIDSYRKRVGGRQDTGS